MIAEAQALLDRENNARTLFYRTAFDLFDWASESVLLKRGTDQQKSDIRQAIATVKRMAHVQRRFQELTDMCMKLDGGTL